MLILAREKDETVMVGDLIEVKVIEIKGGKVLLGFKAPKVVPIHREEIYKRIKEEARNNKSKNDMTFINNKFMTTME